MSKTQMMYFENEDVLHPSISEEPESGSIELNLNITAELNDQRELIGIEIINASSIYETPSWSQCRASYSFENQQSRCQMIRRKTKR